MQRDVETNRGNHRLFPIDLLCPLLVHAGIAALLGHCWLSERLCNVEDQFGTKLHGNNSRRNETNDVRSKAALSQINRITP